MSFEHIRYAVDKKVIKALALLVFFIAYIITFRITKSIDFQLALQKSSMISKNNAALVEVKLL
jgi:hypothetical protein